MCFHGPNFREMTPGSSIFRNIFLTGGLNRHTSIVAKISQIVEGFGIVVVIVIAIVVVVVYVCVCCQLMKKQNA